MEPEVNWAMEWLRKFNMQLLPRLSTPVADTDSFCARRKLPPMILQSAIAADVIAEIARADSTHMTWSLTVLAARGQTSVETFDAVANGEFYPINNDTTAAFSLNGSLLQATFKGPSGETDTLTCTLSADQRKMTCRGALSDGDGRTTTYVDVYDRM